MGQLLQELKRRNVFRVGVAYVVVAWLIIQVIETVSEPLGLPDWTEAFFIVALLAGLPVILLFSWAFELTPEGLKKTRDVDVDESVTATTGKKLNYAIIAVLVLSLGYFLWERQGLVEQAETIADEATEVTQTKGVTSVAVLPFVNMSADPEQEYFSDGISEELLNLLAKIPELRVPARTSSFQFKGQNLDIGDVAKQLNVQHVLEGSVRKADVRVRVTAQLIEADTGYHLWSDTYDRELDDIFAIQDEISAAIVSALSETLGLQSTAVPHVSATNSEAYNAYLLAQHHIKKRTKINIESAISNYEQALEYDPDYAPAHAGIGLAWYLLTDSWETYGTLTLEESLAKALPHLEKALEIDPDLPEALGAMGLVLDTRQQFDQAIPYFEKALTLNPSLTDVRNWYSSVLMDIGRPDDSMLELEHAYELDPLSVLTLSNYVYRLLGRRDFDRAKPVIDRMAQIDAARGAGFRAFMRISQGRAADGVEQLLRAVEQDADYLRNRTDVANYLMGLGFSEAALSIWPNPDDIFGLVAGGTDFEYTLELAQARYEKDPNNLQKLEQLAWANQDAGNRDVALELAGRYLDRLDEHQRPREFTNMIFAFDARERGDNKELLVRVEPLDAVLDEFLASGFDGSFVHSGKAIVSQLLGRTSVAYDHMEKALSRDILPVGRVAYWYEVAGWGESPEFVELQNRHREYMQGESEKLLAKACGPDGFEVWQPSAADCGRAPGPN